MKILTKGLLILLLPLMASMTAHKFYVSVTNVGYSDKDKALQITTRLFIDDLESVLKERYDFEAHLATDQESDVAKDYMERYLRTKFVVEVNGAQASYNYVGKKYDNDVVIFYLEIPEVELSKVNSIQIQNEILTDLFDEQQNIVHFKIGQKKKSFVLMKENTKGVLNL